MTDQETRDVYEHAMRVCVPVCSESVRQNLQESKTAGRDRVSPNTHTEFAGLGLLLLLLLTRNVYDIYIEGIRRTSDRIRSFIKAYTNSRWSL